jgi:hypothetical protein
LPSISLAKLKGEPQSVPRPLERRTGAASPYFRLPFPRRPLSNKPRIHALLTQHKTPSLPQPGSGHPAGNPEVRELSEHFAIQESKSKNCFSFTQGHKAFQPPTPHLSHQSSGVLFFYEIFQKYQKYRKKENEHDCSIFESRWTSLSEIA